MKKWLKKTIAAVLTATTVMSIGTPVFAKNSNLPQEIYVTQQEKEDGSIVFVPTHNLTRSNINTIKAVFDEETNKYKLTSEDNVYLEDNGDEYLALERTPIDSVIALQALDEQCGLSDALQEDVANILENNPNAEVNVYTPYNITPYGYSTSGTYNGVPYRYQLVDVIDRDSSFELATGLNFASVPANVALYAIGNLGTRINTGLAIGAAAMNLLNIDFLEDDISCSADKEEQAYFQYLDFYELGSVYVNRGLNSHGFIDITTKTTCFVSNGNGGYVNQPIYGNPVSGTFGQYRTPNALAELSYPYYNNYSDYSNNVRYEMYTTKFTWSYFNDIPAISPRR